MRISPNIPIQDINVSDLPVFSRAEVHHIVKAIEQGDGLAPVDVARFLDMDPDCHSPKAFERLVGAFPALLAAGSLGIETAREYQGPQMPDWGHMPGVATALINSARGLLPVGYSMASSTAVSQALPNLLLESAAVGGAVGLARLAKRIRDPGQLGKLARVAQIQLRESVISGNQSYKFDQDGGTLAFVGNGARWPDCDDQGAQIDYGQVFQIAYTEGNGIGTVLTEKAGRQAAKDALDCVDINNVKRIIMLPNKQDYDYLVSPDSIDYDMNPPRMYASIKAVDQRRKDAGLLPVSVLVIGNKDQSTFVQTASRSNHFEDPTSIRLEDKMAELAAERGCPIYMLDPTEIVTAEIDRIANGEKLELVASPESIRNYAYEFFKSIRGRVDHTNGVSDGESMATRVIYNTPSDRPTFATAKFQTDRPQDIVVINDPVREEDFEDKGLDSGRIVVVPRIVMQAALPFMHST